MISTIKNYLVLSFFSFCFSYGYTQERPLKIRDSIRTELDEAFNLFLEERMGQSMMLAEACLKYSKDIDDPILIAESSSVLALVAASMNDYAKAIAYHQEEINIFRAEKDTIGLTLAISNLGVTYRQQGDFKRSIKLFEEALSICKDSGQYTFIVQNIGATYGVSGEYNKSLAYLKESNLQAEKLNDTLTILESSVYLAESYYHLKAYDLSEIYANKALGLINELDNIAAKEQIFSLMFRLYQSTSRHTEATALVDSIIKVKDTMFARREAHIYSNFEAKYRLKASNEKLALIEKEKNVHESFNVTLKLFILFFVVFLGLILWKNKQLRRAKNKTERLAKAKNKLYAEISHELRTPLYSIIELVNLFDRNNLNTQQKEDLLSMSFSGNYLLKLVNNVLDYNKLEQNQFKVHLETFQIEDVTSNILSSFKHFAKEQNTTLELLLHPSVPKMIKGDVSKLSQILVNLIFNAIKFTKNGSVTLSVFPVKNSLNDIVLRFKVADTGVGIKKESQELIFKAFYQEKNTNTHSLNGSGLGLAIVLRLLKVLKSDIYLDSELNNGTTISFDVNFTKTPSTNLIKPKKDKNSKSLHGFSVLVVDDNVINLKITERVLQRNDATCKVTNNGKTAIEMIKTEAFDCILMDINMPNLDGYETSKIIRSFNDKVPIILLTASTSDEIQPSIDLLKLDGVITKPYINSVFIDKILTAIDSRN